MSRSSRLAALVAAVALGAGATAAHAGFTAVLGDTLVTGSPVLTTTQAGVITSYQPDSASDPQITGGDLAHFRVTFPTLTFTGPGAGGLSGTYEEYYDIGDIRISSGTIVLNVGALNPDGSYPLDGQIFQTLGPANPAFADITYGQPLNPLSFTGFYRPNIAEPSINGVIVQGLSIPEPTSMIGMTAPALALLARRRK